MSGFFRTEKRERKRVVDLQGGPEDKACHVSDEELADRLLGKELALGHVELLHCVVFRVGAVRMNKKKARDV